MQQRPTDRFADAQAQHDPAAPMSPTTNARTYRRGRGLYLCLFLLGICLEGLYLALSPLLAGNDPVRDPLFQAWRTFLPWLPLKSWTALVPASVWSRLPWFNPASLVGNANLLLVVLCLVMLVVLLAAQVGRLQQNIARRSRSACAWIIIVFGALFALTVLFSPPHLDIFSQDMLLSWLAGRVVVIYHVNPYAVTPALYPHDVATMLLAGLPAHAASAFHGAVGTSGPIGIDIGILVSLLGHDQLANTLLGFRVMGAVLYLGNAFIIWLILRESKPTMIMPMLVLYAWNPLFLLLGVAQMHQEMCSIFLLLLAIYFLQRDANVLSWFFFLLSILINFMGLLLLPLFLRMVIRKTRFLAIGEQCLLWLALLLLSGVVFVLAYLPYWNGWAWSGLLTNITAVFFPVHALNSLDSMLLALPLPAEIVSIFNPLYWCYVLLAFLGIFVLFSLWLADTFDWLLFYASWLFLIFVIFLPLYWPWYILLPLTLVLCSAHGRTLLLAIFLVLGALFSYYCWSRGLDWQGQAIFVLGFPCLLWGWSVFFISTWRMRRANEEELEDARQQIARRPRPPWFSRPSWPSRPDRMRRPNL